MTVDGQPPRFRVYRNFGDPEAQTVVMEEYCFEVI